MLTERSWLARVALPVMMVMVPSAAANAQAVVGSLAGGASLVHGFGDRTNAGHVGGGVEVGSGPVRLGAEASVVHFPEVNRNSYDARGRIISGSSMPAATVGVFAFRASYYLDDFRGRMRPFLTGGLSISPTAGGFATLDGGGGFDWWATPHAGLRVEAREQFAAMFSVRAGLVFK